jgi:hypothetical protein
VSLKQKLRLLFEIDQFLQKYLMCIANNGIIVGEEKYIKKEKSEKLKGEDDSASRQSVLFFVFFLF